MSWQLLLDVYMWLMGWLISFLMDQFITFIEASNIATSKQHLRHIFCVFPFPFPFRPTLFSSFHLMFWFICNIFAKIFSLCAVQYWLNRIDSRFYWFCSEQLPKQLTGGRKLYGDIATHGKLNVNFWHHPVNCYLSTSNYDVTYYARKTSYSIPMPLSH